MLLVSAATESVPNPLVSLLLQILRKCRGFRVYSRLSFSVCPGDADFDSFPLRTRCRYHRRRHLSQKQDPTREIRNGRGYGRVYTILGQQSRRILYWKCTSDGWWKTVRHASNLLNDVLLGGRLFLDLAMIRLRRNIE
jgi:hypothetical protein